MSLVQVVYVGRKPFAVDNVAQSGKQWMGHGDVQEVTPAQARLLVKYPDQWRLVSDKDVAALEASTVMQQTTDDGEVVEVNKDDLQKPVERMNKTELMALAQTMGKELAPTLSKKAMADQIETWKNEGVGGVE